MRLLPGDLLSPRSIFIDRSIKLYASSCECRDGLYSGLNALPLSYFGCFQTIITVTEASGSDCFRMPSMPYRMV
jgi:hypothetical protein